jgi:pyruvate/2-oxoglutarate dehydrogenase complex dihydrolipoamide dehydrogenase (E3) component
VRVDGPAVMRRIHRVIDDGRRYYEDLFARDAGVAIVREPARYVGGRLVVDGAPLVPPGTPTVLAVGARPAVAPLPGVGDVPFLTSDGLLRLEDLPASLAIIGGGPIAVEFAQALRRLDVPVTMVIRADFPLRGEEPEAREALARILREEGVRLVTSARSIALERSPHGVRVRFDGGSAEAAHVLLATGREPTVADIDPESGGVELYDGGARVSDTLATTAPRTFAIGDAIGGDHRRFQFTHVATHEGPQIAENALRGAHLTPRYETMPRVTFTDPEVAAVGLTEAEARERGHDVLAELKPIRQLGKARALGETEGFVKVVLDRGTRRLLGATVFCAHGGDMLAELTIPLHVDGGDLAPVLATTFAHPTLSEAVKVAVRNALGRLS